jgi:hypothetical protein
MCTTCVWASSIFLEKKMDWAKGRQGERKKKPAITTTYVHIYIMLGSFLCGFIYGWIFPGRGK